MRGITGDRMEAGWSVCSKRLSFAEVCSLYQIVSEMNAKGCNNWGINEDDFCDLTVWLSGLIGGKCSELIAEVNNITGDKEEK